MTLSPPLTQSGILLINKPVGMSSARLVAKVKAMSRPRKIGHAGTLDPFADGLMILGLNHGTRISRFFLHGEKSYRATLFFGSETDTLDHTGQVTRTCGEDFFTREPDFFSKEHLDVLLQPFVGPQMQEPPVYSALKHQGVPLYKLARKGKPVKKEARPIVIHTLRLEDVKPPCITISVSCSGGTYIRSLAADIGEKAGCGAHLSALTRTESCGFSLSQATDLDTLEATPDWSSRLISMNDALKDMDEVTVSTDLVGKIRHGRLLFPEDVNGTIVDGTLKILSETRDLVALVEFDKNSGRYNYCCVFQD